MSTRSTWNMSGTPTSRQSGPPGQMCPAGHAAAGRAPRPAEQAALPPSAPAESAQRAQMSCSGSVSMVAATPRAHWLLATLMYWVPCQGDFLDKPHSKHVLCTAVPLQAVHLLVYVQHLKPAAQGHVVSIRVRCRAVGEHLQTIDAVPVTSPFDSRTERF